MLSVLSVLYTNIWFIIIKKNIYIYIYFIYICVFYIYI